MCVCVCVCVCVCCPGWEPIVHLVLGMEQVGHSQTFRRKNRVNCQNLFPGLVFFLLACSHIETGGLGTNNAQCFHWLFPPTGIEQADLPEAVV